MNKSLKKFSLAYLSLLIVLLITIHAKFPHLLFTHYIY